MIMAIRSANNAVVFIYLSDKSLVGGSPLQCRLTHVGFKAVRQIFTSDELRGKHVKQEVKTVFSSTKSLF